MPKYSASATTSPHPATPTSRRQAGEIFGAGSCGAKRDVRGSSRERHHSFEGGFHPPLVIGMMNGKNPHRVHAPRKTPKLSRSACRCDTSRSGASWEQSTHEPSDEIA